MIDKLCRLETCLKPFRTKQKRQGHYCSPECLRIGKARAISKSLMGRPSPKRGTGGRDIVCLNCKKTVHLAAKSNRQLFCSPFCFKQYHVSRRTEREAYKHAAQFKFNVYDHPSHFDLSLIDRFGWYSAANRGGNLDGISRDHMLSIAEGYYCGIDPSLLAHPANCKLVRHSENQKKNAKSTISLEELLQRIAKFDEVPE